MYTAQGASQNPGPATANLLSPKFQTGLYQCVQFAYIFGGNSNVSLSLFGLSEEESGKTLLLWRVNAITSTNSMKWMETEISLPSVVTRLKFVAQLNRRTHGIGIDDVHLNLSPCLGEYV